MPSSMPVTACACCIHTKRDDKQEKKKKKTKTVIQLERTEKEMVEIVQ